MIESAMMIRIGMSMRGPCQLDSAGAIYILI
jgi:hypothetical protein